MTCGSLRTSRACRRRSSCRSRARRRGRRSPSPRSCRARSAGSRPLVSSRIGASSSLSSAALARVETRRRLVEAEQHGFGAHGARDLEPALGAVGQVAGRIVGAVDQHLVEPVFRALDGRARPRDSRGAPRTPSRVKPEARISGLCCATIRFSSTVMPENSRMFWKVRATLRRARDRNPACARAGTRAGVGAGVIESCACPRSVGL